MKEVIVNDDNTISIDYFYPKLVTYLSLRKSLQRGTTKPKELYIKNFHCPCPEHSGFLIQALAADNNDTLRIGKCELSVVEKENMAINSDGKILIDAYRFYSQHPEWKVRAAVAVGLSKIQDDSTILILSELLNDPHYGVKLAVIQALEVSKWAAGRRFLQGINIQETGKRFSKVIRQFLKRVNHTKARVNKHTGPVKGETYWAVTKRPDPKPLRPVLIIKPIKQKPGYFLVAPLTSTGVSSENDIAIDFKGRHSRVQLSHQRMIHQSLFTDRHGKLSEEQSDKVSSQQKSLTAISSKICKKHFKSLAKPTNALIDDTIEIPDPIQTPTRKKNRITLFDFFKPQDQDWLLRASDTNNGGLTYITSKQTQKLQNN